MTAIRWQTTLKDDASTEDTLNAIIATVRVYSKSEFAHNAVKVLRAYAEEHNEPFLKVLFNWACRNIDYKLDPAGNEIIRTPDATVRLTEADCKKFSVLLGSLLLAADIEPVFKHVYYEGEKHYSHIYVIVPKTDNADLQKRNNYTVLDCTNGCHFDKEVEHAESYMYFLNGNVMLGNKLTMMGATQKESLPMAWGKDIGTCAGTMLDGWKTISATPAVSAETTGAVLMFIRHNIHGLADFFGAILAKNPNHFDALIKSLGGNTAVFKQAVLQGAGRPILTKDNAPIGYGGVPPTSYAAVGANVASYSGPDAQGMYTVSTPFGSFGPKPVADVIYWLVSPYYSDASHPAGTSNMTVWEKTVVSQGGNAGAINDVNKTIDLNSLPSIVNGINAIVDASAKPPSKSTIQQVIGTVAPVINTFVPGAGTILAGLANGTTPPAPGGGFPMNPNTVPPPPHGGMKGGNVAGTIGGFFFKGLLLTAVVPHSIALVLCVGVPVITIGLLINKYVSWKQQ